MLDYESLKLIWWVLVGVLLIGFALFGALADKFGRRVVYAMGMVLLAIAYGL